MESAMEPVESEQVEKTELPAEGDQVCDKEESILSLNTTEGSQLEGEAISKEGDQGDQEESTPVEDVACENAEEVEENEDTAAERTEPEKDEPTPTENQSEKEESFHIETEPEKEEPVALGDQPEIVVPGEPPVPAEKIEEECQEATKVEDVERSIEERIEPVEVNTESPLSPPPEEEMEQTENKDSPPMSLTVETSDPEKEQPLAVRKLDEKPEKEKLPPPYVVSEEPEKEMKTVEPSPVITDREETEKIAKVEKPPPIKIEKDEAQIESKKAEPSLERKESEEPKKVKVPEKSPPGSEEEPEQETESIETRDDTLSTLSEMNIDFYYLPGSSPCRAVLLAAKALGVDLNLKLTDLQKGEHLTPEFIKLNPQHTVPTLVDDGFPLWESRVIMTYLASKYGKDDSLYPKDPKKRAVVDQRLYFDVGTLYARYADYYYPVFFGNGSFDSAKMDKIKDAFGFLNTFLKNHDYVAGDYLTVADLSIVATVSTYDVSGFNIDDYPNVARWYTRVKANAPGYEEANEKNVQLFKSMIEPLMRKK